MCVVRRDFVGEKENARARASEERRNNTPPMTSISSGLIEKTRSLKRSNSWREKTRARAPYQTKDQSQAAIVIAVQRLRGRSSHRVTSSPRVWKLVAVACAKKVAVIAEVYNSRCKRFKRNRHSDGKHARHSRRYNRGHLRLIMRHFPLTSLRSIFQNVLFHDLFLVIYCKSIFDLINIRYI